MGCWLSTWSDMEASFRDDTHWNEQRKGFPHMFTGYLATLEMLVWRIKNDRVVGSNIEFGDPANFNAQHTQNPESAPSDTMIHAYSRPTRSLLGLEEAPYSVPQAVHGIRRISALLCSTLNAAPWHVFVAGGSTSRESTPPSDMYFNRQHTVAGQRGWVTCRRALLISLKINFDQDIYTVCLLFISIIIQITIKFTTQPLQLFTIHGTFKGFHFFLKSNL